MSEQLRPYPHTALSVDDSDEAYLQMIFKALESAGGIAHFSEIMAGIENLDPSRPARKNIFIQDAAMNESREKLLLQLEVWQDVLSKQNDSRSVINYCHTKAEEQYETLRSNLSAAVEAVKPLEKTYRNIALFFKNSEKERLPNIAFINCDPEYLKDFAFTNYIDHIAEELKMNFDRVDLRNNYSLLVLPGYLGADAVVEKWAKIAEQGDDYNHLKTDG